MDDPHPTPLGELAALAVQEVEESPGLRHVEAYTMTGLLTLLWHGDPGATGVALACGGAMGGTLGPVDGLYPDLGRFLADQGLGLIRVGYRRPNDLDSCAHDLLAAADLASRNGARRFVTVGHSFGGAVAVQAAAALGDACGGVVTLATQSAGCEPAGELSAPVLLLHGDADTILPPQASELVQMLCRGELVRLAGADHLLRPAGDEVRRRVLAWVAAHLQSTEPA